MVFFIEIQLFGSSRLWRSPTRLPCNLKKGVIDETNLKTKVDYLSGFDLLMVLQGILKETGGCIVRKGHLTHVYFLVFSSETSLNAFIREYSALFLTVPVLSVNYVQNTNCFYRLEDYVKLVDARNSPVSVKTFLESNLNFRYYFLKSSSVGFFSSLYWLLTTAKQ